MLSAVACFALLLGVIFRLCSVVVALSGHCLCYCFMIINDPDQPAIYC